MIQVELAKLGVVLSANLATQQDFKMIQQIRRDHVKAIGATPSRGLEKFESLQMDRQAFVEVHATLILLLSNLLEQWCMEIAKCSLHHACVWTENFVIVDSTITAIENRRNSSAVADILAAKLQKYC